MKKRIVIVMRKKYTKQIILPITKSNLKMLLSDRPISAGNTEYRIPASADIGSGFVFDSEREGVTESSFFIPSVLLRANEASNGLCVQLEFAIPQKMYVTVAALSLFAVIMQISILSDTIVRGEAVHTVMFLPLLVLLLFHGLTAIGYRIKISRFLNAFQEILFA